MRLNQVTVPARDLEASIGFYKSLGLILIVQNDHYARFECPDSDGGDPPTFSIHLDPEATPGAACVYFEEDDLNAVVEHLIDVGLKFDTGPDDQTWLWREAWMTDPAGNRVCLYRAGANRRHPPWRISAETEKTSG
jgi:catechol 2,3-dioxygenase-like lactoylglutathione lyase family enzyme